MEAAGAGLSAAWSAVSAALVPPAALGLVSGERGCAGLCWTMRGRGGRDGAVRVAVRPQQRVMVAAVWVLGAQGPPLPAPTVRDGG